MLSMYSYVIGSECYTENDAVRKQFFECLKKEVEHDGMEVSRECYQIKKKEPRDGLRGGNSMTLILMAAQGSWRRL